MLSPKILSILDASWSIVDNDSEVYTITIMIGVCSGNASVTLHGHAYA